MESTALIYQFGEFSLDVARACVFKAGEEIKLRPKVFETLKYLVENPGRLIGKQELMQAVWPDAFVTDDSLVQCTVELRRALDDRLQQLLKTVPRRGYLFAATVIQCASKPNQSIGIAGRQRTSLCEISRQASPSANTAHFSHRTGTTGVASGRVVAPGRRPAVDPHRRGRRWKDSAGAGSGLGDCGSISSGRINLSLWLPSGIRPCRKPARRSA